ncbi:hypothetical protein RyT2_05800 [Pseudolactococcus yaeyamensis]
MTIKKAKKKKNHFRVIIGSILGVVVVTCIITFGIFMFESKGSWQGVNQTGVKYEDRKISKKLAKAIEQNGTAVEIEGHIITEVPTYNPK